VDGAVGRRQDSLQNAQAVDIVGRGQVNARAVRAEVMLARKVRRDRERRRDFREEAASYRCMLNVVRVCVGAYKWFRRQVLVVRGLVVRGCSRAGNRRCRRYVGGSFCEGFESESEGAQGATGGEGSDVPDWVINKSGFTGRMSALGFGGGGGGVVIS
jgi:hypothetical protein